MAQTGIIPFGQAPWEQAQAQAPAQGISSAGVIPFGKAPWEQSAPSTESSWLDTKLPFGTTPRGLILGAAKDAPLIGGAVGGIAGGIAGSVAPGAGTAIGGVAGAAAGGVAGKSLENTIESALGQGPQSRKEMYEGLGNAGVNMAENEMLGRSIAKAGEAAIASKPGQYAVKKVGNAAAKIASTLSGVPETELKTYAANPAEVNSIAQENDNDPQEMVDQFRQDANDAIQTKRKALNDQISKTLDKRGNQTVSSDPILNELYNQRTKINSTLYPEQLDQIDKIIDKVRGLSSDGKIGLRDAQDLKTYLQEVGSPAYGPDGQIFSYGKGVQRAAKNAAGAARSLIDKAAPEIAESNGTLSELHDIENTMNRNLLAEGKTGASVFAAGSGENPANAKILRRLGDITDTDLIGRAQKISAARQFGKPSLVPVDRTGKSLTRMGLAGATGYLIGGIPGAVVTEGLSSPAAIKAAINGGNLASRVASAAVEKPPLAAVGAAASKVGALASKLIPSGATSSPTAQPNLNVIPTSAPATKGPAKWANDGLQKLQQHAKQNGQSFSGDKGAMLSDPKIKNLLIAASDLKPGTKAMDQIMTKIKNRLAGGKK